jgi:single-strand DNA-binding protein
MSNGINKHILVGHLGKNPEQAATQSGAKVVRFSVAVGKRWRDRASGEQREQTSWHNIVILNEQLGEIAMKYLKKGSQVYLEGESLTRTYEKGGEKRYITETVLAPYRGALTLLDRAEGSGTPDENAYSSQGGPIDDDIPY